MDDERRRPISKAYVSSLSARITLLESMLQENGIPIPPATHPPMTKHETPSAGSGDEVRISATEARRRSKSDTNSPINHILSPPYSHDDFATYESPIDEAIRADVLQSREEPFRRDHSSLRTLDLGQEDVMHRLFFPDGGLSCDRLSGKLRFFGPTANCHVYAEPPRLCSSRDPSEQTRRAERIIRSLTPKTHDHLMQSFWKHHNSVLQVIDRAAFEADRGSENPKYYSSFLHIVILAIGWRFANKDRFDVARINIGNYKSTLHREARYMLDAELEGPLGITSVQSLLLLGDLECGVGRDDMGSMFTGMANNLAIDIGLRVDCRNIGLAEREVSVRRRVMRACFLYDRFWALLLGRPTTIKSQDLGLDILKTTTSTIRLFEHNPSMHTDTQAMEEEIHEQLVELMEIAGRIVESQNEARSGHDANQTASLTVEGAKEKESADLQMLDLQLREWYEGLPNHLTWRSDNIRTAPCGYFLLHEQYYAIMILLHRLGEARGPQSNEGSSSKESEDSATPRFSASDEIDFRDLANSHTKQAHDSCTQAAIQLAQIVSQYRDKYELEKTCCTGLQPAGTAAIALLAAIAYNKDEDAQRLLMPSLEVLSDAIRVMSHSYQPAARMQNLIQSVLAHLQPNARDTQHNRGANSGKNCGEPQAKHIDTFSLLPMHQGRRRDGGKYPSNDNHSCVIPNQPTPEPARQPNFHTPANSSCQSSFSHQLNSMSGLLPTFSDMPGMSVYLNSTHNPVLGLDNIYASRQGLDNYLRVAPSAKGWGLQSLHAASHPEQPNTDFDSHMLDWMGDSGNFDGAATLHEPKFDGPSVVLGRGISADIDNTLLECKREDTGSLVWMNGEGGISELTPVSPKDFTQSSRKTDFNHGRKSAATPLRNHELDYLSL
ncbi:hypothetical protein NUW58_g3421 [Xylaria curta]|uniref:Uncharacterized protein n=1 Tax=Xylaria curta TaxID=42375 RepID=A0ACC1PDE7_9PEZI|nr:hypothetical protein NUW58_g3421 [Xylaria curta]